MTDETLPAHSPLGASSAERWMNCPGSIALLKNLKIIEDTDEPDYRREGIAGHEAAAECLARDIDTWEIIHETFHDTKIDEDMAQAIQVYLDRVRPGIHGYHGSHFFIEARLARPEIHPAMFGTVDFAALKHDEQGDFLDVTDLKMGVGIIVDPHDNEQMKYYAFMLLDQHFVQLEDETRVRLTIVQPRAFHQEGPIRQWWTTAGYIRNWVKDELVPAMINAEMNAELDAGPWCRFCPAKLVCPLLTSLFGAAAKADPKITAHISDASLGRSYQYTGAVKFYLKALEEEVFRRLSTGKPVPGTKLVSKKANRVFPATIAPDEEGGKPRPIAEVIQEKFGADAFSKPEIKGPATLEKLSQEARDFVQEYAYTPQAGLTVALEHDSRIGIRIERPSEVFSGTVPTPIE